MGGDSLPSGWRLVKLGDLGEVNRGRSRHRPRYAEHLYGGPYPFIQTGDIKNSGGRITGYQQTYSEAGLAQSRMWPAGTMCITIAANIAETGVLTFSACFPDSVVGFVAEESKCDVHFVEYTFRHLRQEIQHEASGSVQDNINLATLERLRFPLPPLSEQRAIAHILGTLDDKIELNRRMSETLEAMARALFKSWFVESELGEIPGEWGVKPLDEVADFVNGAACQKYTARPGEPSLPVIKIRELNQGVTPQSDRVRADFPPKHLAKDGDLLFSWSGSLICKLWTGGPGFVNQHVFRVSSEEYPQWFYGAWTSRYLESFQTIAAGKATTMGHIKRRHLSESLALCPESNLLEAMTRICEPCIERQVECDLESRTLTALRDTLLPKLISGQLRVPEAECQFQEVP